MMMLVMMRILKGRPVELVHLDLGVELNDRLAREGAGPRPRLEIGRRALRRSKCVGDGDRGGGAGALFHHRPPPQT